MQLTHIRTSDLNLLLAALVLFEERKISAAAIRFNLSQPAMSRLLQRLRETFRDELLVRGANGYELTPRARQLQESLAVLLPELDRLIAGPKFDPARARETFRIALTDYAALVIAPPLMAALAQSSPGIVLDLQAWNADGSIWHSGLRMRRRRWNARRCSTRISFALWMPTTPQVMSR